MIAKKLIIIGFFCLFSVLAKAGVHVQIDPAQVSLGESFRLIITQSDLQNGGIPDLTPLQKDFIIVGTERRVNYSIINGQSQSSSEWTVSLQAKKEGILTIPAIKMGSELTTPITLNVSTNPNPQAEPANSDQEQGLFLTTEVNKKNPYVNQQVIYKVSLYNSKQLLDADYQGPQVENALVIPLGENKRYQTQKNNVTYLVEEQNYAIFPQKSGTLKITSPTFTALVYDLNPQKIKAQDKAINLNVLPIPKGYSGKEWLPAKQVKLTETYENADQTLTQGNTLVRTVTLEGIGIPAQLLPALNFAESNNFNVYPEKGKDKNQVVQGQLIGRTEIKVTYLFNQAGTVTIPELKLSWFNTETGKEEIARLAPRTIEITPSNTASAPSSGQPAVTQNETTTLPDQKLQEPSSTSPNNWAWITAAVFAAAWLLTLALWGWQRRNRTNGTGQYKRALNDLHKACNQANPQQARDALLKWARMHWPDASILNLTDLTHLTHDAPLKKQVQILSQVLYKNNEKSLWRGDELWRSVQAIRHTHADKKRKTSVLPPINPI